jgi:hypothetical protein
LERQLLERQLLERQLLEKQLLERQLLERQLLERQLLADSQFSNELHDSPIRRSIGKAAGGAQLNSEQDAEIPLRAAGPAPAPIANGQPPLLLLPGDCVPLTIKSMERVHGKSLTDYRNVTRNVKTD